MQIRMIAGARQKLASAKRFASTQYFTYRENRYDFHKLNVCYSFPMFQPYSSGSYQARAELTMEAINQTIPRLSSLASSLQCRMASDQHIRDFPKSEDELGAAAALKRYFDIYGSDKARLHEYHYVYGPILMDRSAVTGVLEIGIGTNYVDVVSSMGKHGKPGASLRAFRDFFKEAKVYGADVDKRILFVEDRIATFFVDQTDPSSFLQLAERVPQELDLVIDDGLHTPNANIETLKFGLTKIKRGGWVVVEDIGSPALPIWQVVSSLLPANFRAHIIRGEAANMFAVNRLD